MKRHPALQKLSREHHTALSLALAAKRAVAAGDPATLAAAARRVIAAFARELELHFREEEDGLLPQLLQAGQQELVERTLAEHAELRQLAELLKVPNADTLNRFAFLLTAHVRFEERALFEAAETLLPEAPAPAPAE